MCESSDTLVIDLFLFFPRCLKGERGNLSGHHGVSRMAALRNQHIKKKKKEKIEEEEEENRKNEIK